MQALQTSNPLQSVCKDILNDVPDNISRLSALDLIQPTQYLECNLTEEVLKNQITILNFAMGLRKVEIVKMIVDKIVDNTPENLPAVGWNYKDSNYPISLGYSTLCQLFIFIDVGSFSEIKSLFAQTAEFEEWEAENEAKEEVDAELDWENENDTDISELYLQDYLEIMDYLLLRDISSSIQNTNILIKASLVRIFDSEFVVLKKLLPLWQDKLNIDYNYEEKLIPIISIAVTTPSFELLKILLDQGYDVNDFTNTMYNPVFESWRAYTNAKMKKDGSVKIYKQIYDTLLPQNLQFAYNRGAAEFGAIFVNQFTIVEAQYLNKVKNIELIAKTRFASFQTLLSVCRTEITADAVLQINGIDPNQVVPVGRKGQDIILGVAAQVVTTEALNVILPEMKIDRVYPMIPYFLEAKKTESLYATLVYLDQESQDDPYLDPKNLIRLGLTRAEYNEYIKRRDLNRSSEECCYCGIKTNQKLECGHFSHYECLSKCTSTKCAFCKQEYKLPEPYSSKQTEFIRKEKDKADREWNRRYLELTERYGGSENIPSNVLFDVSEGH